METKTSYVIAAPDREAVITAHNTAKDNALVAYRVMLPITREAVKVAVDEVLGVIDSEDLELKKLSLIAWFDSEDPTLVSQYTTKINAASRNMLDSLLGQYESDYSAQLIAFKNLGNALMLPETRVDSTLYERYLTPANEYPERLAFSTAIVNYNAASIALDEIDREVAEYSELVKFDETAKSNNDYTYVVDALILVGKTANQAVKIVKGLMGGSVLGGSTTNPNPEGRKPKIGQYGAIINGKETMGGSNLMAVKCVWAALGLTKWNTTGTNKTTIDITTATKTSHLSGGTEIGWKGLVTAMHTQIVAAGKWNDSIMFSPTGGGGEYISWNKVK